MVRFVLRSHKAISRIEKLVPSLVNKFPSIKVVSVNVQPVAHAILEGEEEVTLTERQFLVESFDGKRVHYFPQAFSQVTPSVAKSLYQFVADALARDKAFHFWDLYGGVGCFSLFVAPQVLSLKLIETSEAALKSARLNFSKLSVPWELIHSPVESFLARQRALEKDTLFMLNPPRRGLGESVVGHILRLGPERIYYSSCSKESLFRDLKGLSEVYEIQSLTPFNMFPGTSHLEVLAILSKIQ